MHLFNLLILNTHMARLTRQPKEVDTARGERLRPEKSLVKEEVRAMRGRSSATTTHVRMQDRSTERAFSCGTELPRPLVHSSITPKELEGDLTAAWSLKC